MKLVAEVIGPGGRKWKIYHGSNKEHPAQFTKPDNGELCDGITWFRGRWKNKVFINIDGASDHDRFDTTVHELMHIALSDLGLHPLIEEPIVAETAARMAVMLEQL